MTKLAVDYRMVLYSFYMLDKVCFIVIYGLVTVRYLAVYYLPSLLISLSYN